MDFCCSHNASHPNMWMESLIGDLEEPSSDQKESAAGASGAQSQDVCHRRQRWHPQGQHHLQGVIFAINITIASTPLFDTRIKVCPNDKMVSSWPLRAPLAASRPSARPLAPARSQRGLENMVWHHRETPRTETGRRSAKNYLLSCHLCLRLSLIFSDA